MDSSEIAKLRYDCLVRDSDGKVDYAKSKALFDYVIDGTVPAEAKATTDEAAAQ